MTAKEMFEKLDYEYLETKHYIRYKKIHWKHWIFKVERTIEFWKDDLSVQIYEKYGCELSLQELQAINKQVEELRWNKWK